MKAYRIISILVIAVICLPPRSADAQFSRLRDKVKEKVEQKVEQKVEEKVEERAERALDAAVGNTIDSIADNLESSLQGMLFSNEPQPPIELGPNEVGSPDAPYVRYTVVSRIELGGSGSGLASRLLRRFGTQQETVSTHGDKQRVDTGTESSQIMDAGNRKIIHIDHKKKEWWSISFEEMMAPIAELSRQELSSVQSSESAGSTTLTDDESAGSLKLTDAKISVDNTGVTKSINGTKASQTVMVVEGEYEVTAPDEETGETVTVRGKSYAVYEVWQSTDVAGYKTLASYQAEAAKAMGAALSGTGVPEMLSAMKGVPQLPAGTDEALSKLESEEGLPVRTKLHFVQVAEDATLDLKAVLNESGSSLEANPDGEAPSQFVLMTMISEIGDLSTAPLEAGHFDPPSTFTEISSPMKAATSQ